MEILSGQQMRNVDRRAIETLGIAGLLLMESAGRAIADALLEDHPELRERRLVVLCGKGNNGGDGLVAARHLRRRGLRPRVVLLAAAGDLSGDAAINLRAARASGVDVAEAPDEAAWSDRREMLEGTPLVLDAILGTGISGGARGLAAAVIADLGRSGASVVSVDLPSGLDADSADPAESSVAAERTYTLCRPKPALVLEPAARRAGRWRVLPIGIPDSAVAEERAGLEWLDGNTAATLLPAREPDTHKGSYGHLLVVAGSPGKSGAAALVAGAALRAGVGLVTAAVGAGIQDLVAAHRAEVMTEALPEDASGALAADAADAAVGLLDGRDALALGPGLGGSSGARRAALDLLARSDCPAVVDADGLNAAAGGDLSGLDGRRRPLVLTPHPGEASRLLGRPTSAIQADRLGAATELAERTGAVVVLKGHRTIVADPGGRAAVNASGNPGMASGGTGDVLTGVVGALLARGLEPWVAARLAVFVHGDAGDRAAGVRGEDGLVAGDVLDALPAALRALRGARPERPW